MYIYTHTHIHIYICSNHIYIFVHTYTNLCDAKKKNLHISYKIVTKTGKSSVCSGAKSCRCSASEDFSTKVVSYICVHVWAAQTSQRETKKLCDRKGLVVQKQGGRMNVN